MNSPIEFPAQKSRDAARPTAPELVRRAGALVPTLRARAAETERERRVSDQATQMIRDADLYRLMQPARFGGFEYGFSALIEVTAEIGRGCGSTAWCYGLGAVHQWLLGTFPLEAQEEVWRDDPGTLVCGSYAPVAKAEPVGGGYRIQGRWGFASNCDNSGWAMLGVMFPPEEGGTAPLPGFLLVPRTQYRIEDTWSVVGLAGTGSKTLVIDEPLIVPPHRKLTFAQAASGQPPGAAANTNPLYRIPFLSAVPVSIISPGIGMVQGAIDEFLDWIGARTTRGAVAGGGNQMAQFAQVQSRVAEASAALDAARLLLERDTRDVEQCVVQGNSISLEQRMRNRRDHAYAARLLTQGVNAMFDAVGGGGLNLDNGIQRAWRDVNALSRHISMNWDAVSTMYGQYRFGLEPKGQY